MAVMGWGRGAVLLGLGLALAAAPAAAQARAGGAQPAAPKGGVAYLNVRGALQQTPGFAQAESTFAKDLEGYRAELARLEASLDSAAQGFQASQAMMNSAQRAAKQKELEEQQRTLQQKAGELQQRAAQREQELMSPMQKKVLAAVEAIRAEGGFALIFDVSAQGSNIITGDPALDLTQRVIQKLKASTN